MDQVEAAVDETSVRLPSLAEFSELELFWLLDNALHKKVGFTCLISYRVFIVERRLLDRSNLV